jgi:ABC-type amino acid transport substrate-binding protein
MKGDKGKSRRVSLSVFIGLIVICFASAAAAKDPLTKEERGWSTKHGVVQVGAFTDYPPFGFVDAKGQAQGMSVDFWNLMASQLGFKVKFHPTLFTKQLEGLKSGQFDSLAGIFPLEERKQSFDFTKQYTVIATNVYVRPKYDNLKGLADLKGLKVGTVEGDSGQLIAEKAGLKPIGFKSYPDAIRALGEDRIDAIIMDELVVKYYAAKYGLKGRIKKIGEPVDQGKMTLPVAKGNSVLLGILNKGVISVSAQEWTKIRQKWMGK